MLISTILLILLLFYLNTKPRKLFDNRTGSQLFKFIAALLVVNCHLLSESGFREASLGSCCVSFFLMMSGYGLSFSYLKKGEIYLTCFLSKRIMGVLIPLITAYAIALPIYSYFVSPIDWGNMLGTLYWGGPYLQYSWYVTEIIVLYMMYYLIMKRKASYISNIKFLSLCVCILMFVLFIGRQPEWYIISLPAFILGLWLPIFENGMIGKHFDDLLQNDRKLLLVYISLSVIFIILFRWEIIANIVTSLNRNRFYFVNGFIYNILFATLVYIILSRIKIRWGGECAI